MNRREHEPLIRLTSIPLTELTGSLVFRLTPPNPGVATSDPLAIHLADPFIAQNSDILDAILVRKKPQFDKMTESETTTAWGNCRRILETVAAGEKTTQPVDPVVIAKVGLVMMRISSRMEDLSWEHGRGVGKGEGINELYNSTLNGV